jgi:hypothetical protein
MHANRVGAQHPQHGVGTATIGVVAEDVGLDAIGAGQVVAVAEELLLVAQQVGAVRERSLQRGEGGEELVADPEAEGQRPTPGVLQVAARARLLEENADGAVDVRVGRALAVVEVVEAFLGEVEASFRVQGAGVIRGERLG